jgi:hypothetical protein
MSVDEQDESRGDGGTAPEVPPHVPGQGGRAGAPQSGDAAEGGVPSQRDRREDSVLPPPRETPSSDAELIERMRAGDDTAYEELYRRHAEAVRRYARTCCRDAHTADDLTAEVFARMLQAVRGGSGPEMRMADSSWVWQRQGLSITGKQYAHGVTVQGNSSVTIDLNRSCTSYDAMVGVDDMTMKLGKVYFSVYGDGVQLWKSDRVKGGDPAVPVHVDITGRQTLRLVVEPHNHLDNTAPADWAESKFVCS